MPQPVVQAHGGVQVWHGAIAAGDGQGHDRRVEGYVSSIPRIHLIQGEPDIDQLARRPVGPRVGRNVADLVAGKLDVRFGGRQAERLDAQIGERV